MHIKIKRTQTMVLSYLLNSHQMQIQRIVKFILTPLGIAGMMGTTEIVEY